MLLTVSCETLSGQLVALTKLNFKKGVIVEEGTHQSEIKIKKRSLKITINDGETIKFKIPKGRTIPSENGQIFLTQSEISQPYDIQGSVMTKFLDSESRSGYESCSYSQPYTVCYPDGRGRMRCYTEYRSIYGSRSVQYRLRKEEKDIVVELMAPGSSLIKGKFTGKKIKQYRMYEYQGACY